jgi:DNA repair protein RecN (Recombination protein N)
VLTTLRIRNFVLMDELELELDKGLNVLTGETGAGKSIVVGALALVLGGRANAEQVRPGATEAEIEALFEVGGSERLKGTLEAAGVSRDGELVIRRVVQANGRSRAYLNGRLCTAGELQALASELADVASQHESVALTDPSTHLSYLDRFARLVDQRDDLAKRVGAIESIVAKLREARELEKTRGEREAFLQFQLQAIDALSPKPGEQDELLAERNRLRHSGKLHDVTERIANRLEQGEATISDELARMVRELRAAAELDATLAPTVEELDSAWNQVAEAGRTLGHYAERAEANPDRLSEIEERLYRLEGLLRQHGPTIEDVLATRDRLASDLHKLEQATSTIAELEKERDAALVSAGDLAKKLSAKRKKAADKLGATISSELVELGMGGAKVIVDVAALGGDAGELSVGGMRLGQDGIDRVEFMISPNKGLEPKPLRKIASGGELSRALLALKRSLAECGPAGLYVFDEVDTGVGGAVADKIGRAIADVAKHHQVLCITHLAPIAAFGDAHYVVTKDAAGAMAKSAVHRVQGKARVAEIARMLAGAKVTAGALKAAEELVREAQSPK